MKRSFELILLNFEKCRNRFIVLPTIKNETNTKAVLTVMETLAVKQINKP